MLCSFCVLSSAFSVKENPKNGINPSIRDNAFKNAQLILETTVRNETWLQNDEMSLSYNDLFELNVAALSVGNLELLKLVNKINNKNLQTLSLPGKDCISTKILPSQYRDMGIDDFTIDQLCKSPDQRTWRGCENVDALQHPDFSTQKSFAVSEAGDYEEVTYGIKDSQRPDEIRLTDEGIDIREIKNWSDADSLAHNIREQAEDRYELFGDDLNDLTFVVSPKFSIEDCDKLEETCRKSGADIEFKYH